MRKKIISLICAVAMVATLFSAFTVVSAAGPSIQGTATKTGNTVELTVNISGFENCSALQFLVPIDTEVFTLASSDVVAPFVDDYCNPAADGGYSFVWSAANAKQYVPAIDKTDVLKLTLTINDGKEAPDDITLSKVVAQDETKENGEDKTVKYNAANPLTATEIPVVDPSAGDPAQKRPDGTNDPAPSEKPVVTGAQLNSEAVLDGNKVTLTYSIQDFENCSALQFLVPIDTTKYTLTDSKVIEPFVDDYCNPAADGGYSFVWSAANAKQYVPATDSTNVLELTLTLTDAGVAALPFDITPTKVVAQDETKDNGTDKTVKYNAANPLGTTAATVEAPAKEYDKEEIKLLGDIIDTEDAAKVGSDDASSNSPYYVVVNATKDGKPAEYGKDYTAYYKGLPLTKAQLNNYLVGKYGTIADALANITFDADEGVEITAELDKDGSKYPLATGETTVGGQTKSDTEIKYAVTAKKGNATIKSGTSTKLNSGDKIVLTPNFTDGESAKGVAYTQTGATKISATAATFSGVANPGIKITYTPAGATEAVEEYLTITQKSFDVPAGATDIAVEFTAYNASTTDTQAIAITFETTSNDPANATPSDKFEVTVNKLSTTTPGNNNNGGSGSSSDNNSSGGNVIATGNQNVINGGNVIAGGFTDLNDAPWASAAITALAAQGVVSGRGDGTFDPNANITRAEYCQILINAINKSNEYADASFYDVPTDAWFYHAVAVASKYGIVQGYGDGNFGPYDLITREQMALMTQKAAQVMNVNLSATTSASFSDDAAIADWSRAAVYELANAGIINGMDDGTFAPKANATRAQAAVIIYSTFVK